MFFSTRVAAVEFDSDTVRVVVVKISGSTPQITESHEITATYDQPEGRFEALVTAVDEAVGKLRSRPAAFVLCVPTGYSVVRILRIPLRGRRKVATAVPFELEPYLAFPIEELLVDFTITSEKAGETQVLAVGSRREPLDEQTAVLDAAGLEVEAVGLDAAGLTALWQAGRKGLKGLNAILHVRHHSAILAITHNKTLVYFRHIARSEEEIRENPACIARDVQNTLRGFMADWRDSAEIEVLHITGLALDDEVREQLSNELRLTVIDEILLERCKGSGGLPGAEDGPPAGNLWEAAIGVAVGATGGKSAFDFKRFERDWSGSIRGVVTHVMFSACLALIALVGWGYWCYMGAARNDAWVLELEKQKESVSQDIAGIQAQGLTNVSETTMQLLRDPTLLDILGVASGDMPGNEVLITEIKINAPGTTKTWITVKGETADVATFNKALDNLRKRTYFDIVQEPGVRMEDKTYFEINIQRPGETVEEGAVQ